MKRLTAILTLLAALPAFADSLVGKYADEDKLNTPWQEGKYELPKFPDDANLIEFYVSPTAQAKFYIDSTSFTPSLDENVIRYVLVVKTAGGASNISFEGIRCDAHEMRIYATANSEHQWVESRQSEWQPFKSYNTQQKALAYNYVCPDSIVVRTRAEGIDALKRGGHPSILEHYSR